MVRHFIDGLETTPESHFAGAGVLVGYTWISIFGTSYRVVCRIECIY
jgi:hypothetical protein